MHIIPPFGGCICISKQEHIQNLLGASSQFISNSFAAVNSSGGYGINSIGTSAFTLQYSTFVTNKLKYLYSCPLATISNNDDWTNVNCTNYTGCDAGSTNNTATNW